MKLTGNKIFSYMLAAAFALTLAGCGGGGGGAAMDDDDMMPPVMMCPEGQVGTYPDCMTAQQMCEAGGGRYEADGMCTSAEDRITEAARNSCVAAGGRFEADGMCTSASAVAQETCEGEGGRYEMNGSCTSSEAVAKEMCVAGGGRSNADGSCTSAGIPTTRPIRKRRSMRKACRRAPMALIGRRHCRRNQSTSHTKTATCRFRSAEAPMMTKWISLKRRTDRRGRQHRQHERSSDHRMMTA